MEDVFDVLSSLCTDGDKNAPQAAKIIVLARQAGVLDPRQPVGSHALPLVHALANDKILGVSWLEIFDEPSDPFGLYESFSGRSLGTYLLKDPSTWESWQQDQFLDTFQWWLDRKGAPGELEAARWAAMLEAPADSYRTKDQATFLIEKLLDTLPSKVPSSDDKGLHPEMRWASTKSYWNYFKDHGKLDDIVLCPSGQSRTLLDSLFLSNQDHREFDYWVSSLPGIASLKLPMASHARSRDLVHGWSLDGSIDLDEACMRLVASIKKTDRAWDLVYRGVDNIPRLDEVFAHRDASGLCIKDWFFAQAQGELIWPSRVSDLDSGLSDGIFPAMARAALLAKAPRGLANYCNAKKLGGRFEPGTLSDRHKRFLFGSKQDQAQMVDLLVDAIVHPNTPPYAATSLARQVLRLGDPNVVPGYEKLSQAMKLEAMWNLASNLKMGSRLQSGELVKRTREKNQKDALAHLERIVPEILASGALLHLTREEWNEICKKRGASALPKKAFALVNEMFTRHGESVEIDVGTRPVVARSIHRGSPRL